MVRCFAERARALVGCPFRPQGRDPEAGLDCIGVIATTFDIPVEQVARDYRLRGGELSRLRVELGRYFRRVSATALRPGDLLLFSIGATQMHLAVQTERGFVHADAGLRRVVETPGPASWHLLSVFRRRVRCNQGQ